jgi:hypothetical protein
MPPKRTMNTIVGAARKWAALDGPEILERITAAIFEAEWDTVTWEEAKAHYTDEDEGFDRDIFKGDHRFYIEAGEAVLAALKGSE